MKKNDQSDDFISTITALGKATGEDNRKKSPDKSNIILDDLSIDIYEAPEPTSLQRNKIQELNSIVKRIDKLKNSKVKIPKFGKQYKIKYKDKLNDEQLAAVVSVKGPLMVIAGAGTGKTYLLSYRVAYLLESGINPSDILILTFTRKAADEMLNRVQEIRTDRLSTPVTGGTFHSLAVKLIRQYHHDFGLIQNFTIVDKGRSESAIDLARTAHGLNKIEVKFPAKSMIADIISMSRNKGISIKDVVLDKFPDDEDHIENIEKVYDAYSTFKKASDILDFDDLMEVLRNKLRDDDKFRKKIQDKYQYIMVDEYQDTNLIQKDIVNLMTNDDQNVMIVGDDAQSIYAFRGANYENILRFPETYPKTKVIKLEKNYRSTQEIIDFTNSVNNSFLIGYKKELKAADNDSGDKPVVMKFLNQEEEAIYIADEILRLREKDIPLENIAILVRNNDFKKPIEPELIKRKILYQVVGGIKFMEKDHIRDVLSYLNIIQNPKDAIAWHRILKLEYRIRIKTILKIIQEINNNLGQFDSLINNPSFHIRVSELTKKLKEIRDSKGNVSDKVDAILNYYKPILKKKDKNYNNSIRDLKILRNTAADYKNIDELLSDFALNPLGDEFAEEINPLEDDNLEGTVTISTIHSAKGLDWGYVFIPCALDGLFPSDKAFGDIESIEEENRVFYVATTRAEHELHITMPSKTVYHKGFFSLPTRFLLKIDQKTFTHNLNGLKRDDGIDL